MPDYRLLHRRALRGEKVAALTDFERGVWLAYLLVADDYGVMPFDAGELSRAIWLKGKPHKVVQKALERVREVGLIQTWVHQGTVYCYAYDWQEWQNVRHPRGTIEPCPPADVLATCKLKTQQLFADHSRIAGDSDSAEFCVESSADFGKVPQMPRLARAGGRETQTLTANANANAEGGPGETAPPRPARGLGAGVMAGSLPRDHIRHAHCGRVCVPDFLHHELVQKVGGIDPDGRVRQFYADVLAAIPPDQPIGDEPLKFWRTQFAARFGSAVPQGRTAGNRAAAERFIARGRS